MKLRTIPILILFIFLAGQIAFAEAADIVPFTEVKPQRIGEFVTVSGHVAAFYPPPEPRAPFAFSLKDAGGQQMRVVVWPDIFFRVEKHQHLEQPGTTVTLTAEIAEYNEKLELHLQDWEEITVEADSEVTTTSAVSTETTAAGNLWWGGGEMTSQPLVLPPTRPGEQETTGPAIQ